MTSRTKRIIAMAAASYLLYVGLIAWLLYPMFRLSLLGIIIDPVLWIIVGIAVWQCRKRPAKTVAKVPYYER